MFRHTLHMECPATTAGFEEMRTLLDMNFPKGYTLSTGQGSFGGVRENCAIVTIIADMTLDLSISSFCVAYKAAFKQQSVLQTTDLISVTWR